MISSLYNYSIYARNNKLEGFPPFGMSIVKINYYLELNSNGDIVSFTPLSRTENDKKPNKRKEDIPYEFAPLQKGRSSGKVPYFLCDNNSYILGVDIKKIDIEVTKDSEEKRKLSSELHHSVLNSIDNEIAKAILRFFETWNPKENLNIIKEYFKNENKSVNIAFRVNGKKAIDNEEILKAWNSYYLNELSKNKTIGRCSITGEIGPISKTHGKIYNVDGANRAGSSLVSFNNSSFCSYGKEQGDNSPISEKVVEGYTSALNYLLKSSTNKFSEFKNIICWTESKGSEETLFNSLFFDFDEYNSLGSREILNIVNEISQGNNISLNGKTIDSSIYFNILGLAPANARIFVNLYYKNTFGNLIINIKKHYDRMELINAKLIKPYQIIDDLFPSNSKNIKFDLLSALISSIINDTRYPETIFYKIMIRIRADRKFCVYEKNTGEKRFDYSSRTSFIKAYLLKNSSNIKMKEVLTVELNKETTYLPYVLGKIFAVLEHIQIKALPEIGNTIKDRYFDGASSTPSVVFPTLLQLSQKHLSKLKKSEKSKTTAYFLENELTELISKISESFPTNLSLEDQGVFIIGYYHQKESFYKKQGDGEK